MDRIRSAGRYALLIDIEQMNKAIEKTNDSQEILIMKSRKQEIKVENDNTALEEIWNEFYKCKRYEVRSMLARCEQTNEYIDSKISKSSDGEHSKIRLCELINKPSNILILDEPTNHLDIDAKNEQKKH
ncbi:ATP-binding cassette domain-containing protein [Metaclostridioides mangenotii]|uniref:ATP-binding cassette domain-containing protein n=1 Tax=Metaclostridioides mangenotii TaxID=1540 RepID=UPI0026EFDF93|nr:ATP-binding cassette domain-containing protein [Clostridioides mangenotii]